jgi:hypothetical protein
LTWQGKVGLDLRERDLKHALQRDSLPEMSNIEGHLSTEAPTGESESCRGMGEGIAFAYPGIESTYIAAGCKR